MARVAGERKLAGDVIRIGRVFVVGRMARITVRRHGLKLAVGCTLVAGIAGDGCMRANEREAVVMLLNLLDRNLPASNRVALFAVGSQLTPMDIGVAILTALTDVGEYRLHVALRACN